MGEELIHCTRRSSPGREAPCSMTLLVDGRSRLNSLRFRSAEAAMTVGEPTARSGRGEHRAHGTTPRRWSVRRGCGAMERALHPDLAKRAALTRRTAASLDETTAEWMIDATGRASRPNDRDPGDRGDRSRGRGRPRHDRGCDRSLQRLLQGCCASTVLNALSGWRMARCTHSSGPRPRRAQSVAIARQLDTAEEALLDAAERVLGA